MIPDRFRDDYDPPLGYYPDDRPTREELAAEARAEAEGAYCRCLGCGEDTSTCECSAPTDEPALRFDLDVLLFA